MATPPSATPSKGSGLSLYANLLDPSASGSASIIKAPVVFKQDAAKDEASAKKQQINAAALKFQPTKRPQLASQKAKPKSTIPKPAPTTQSIDRPVASIQSQSRAPLKTTLADWTSNNDDDVNGFYAGTGEKRQRGGRKRRKKAPEERVIVQDWDDIYDPSRPNNYEEYKHSDEKVREVREWKDRLYAHRAARRSSSDIDSEDDDLRRPQMLNQFAPPAALSFAPPPVEPLQDTAPIEDRTGADAYAQRSVLSQSHAPPPPPPPPPPAPQPEIALPPTPPPPTPVKEQSGVISRAPVRYSLPAPPPDIPASEEELQEVFDAEEDVETPAEADANATRSLRPGQKGFAERLMSKYGWSKGSGLGADGSGITNALRVQVEKRKKKSDAEGGGWADPKGIGKIIGGRKAPGKDAPGRFGNMSEVVVLRGMVDGMNLDEEVGDGGLMQEIGDECGEKYGNVERVYIDRTAEPAKVFVRFTSQLSALRAVNALEGRIFSGNTISARFFETEKFEKRIFE